jgi:hypothetical protein
MYLHQLTHHQVAASAPAAPSHSRFVQRKGRNGKKWNPDIMLHAIFGKIVKLLKGGDALTIEKYE